MAHFKRSLSVTPWGVVDEEKKLGTILLSSSLLGSSTASHLISIIESYLNGVDVSNKEKLSITFDNCAVNKNR